MKVSEMNTSEIKHNLAFKITDVVVHNSQGILLFVLVMQISYHIQGVPNIWLMEWIWPKSHIIWPPVLALGLEMTHMPHTEHAGPGPGVAPSGTYAACSTHMGSVQNPQLPHVGPSAHSDRSGTLTACYNQDPQGQMSLASLPYTKLMSWLTQIIVSLLRTLIPSLLYNQLTCS